MPSSESLPDSTDTPLHELWRLAREKGYAIDFAIYGGEHLDEYVGGARITGAYANPMDAIERGCAALKDLAANDAWLSKHGLASKTRRAGR